jgi:hypothetical protein
MTFNLDAQFCGTNASSFPNSSNNLNSSSSATCAPDVNFDITVPVYFHFATSNFNQVTLSTNQINEVISDLNSAFQYSSLGNSNRITFVLAAFDENGDCFDGYKIHDLNGFNIFYSDSHQSNIEDAYPDENKREFVLNNYINLWYGAEVRLGAVNSSYAEILGYSVFPPSMSGISATERYPSNFMGLNASFDKVKATTIHELGHFFGLIHTFNGGCQDNNNPNIDECFGDQISTTPFCDEVIPNYTGPEDCNTTFLTCNNEIHPIKNYMSSYVSCFKEFVPEQFDRMGMFLNDYSTMFSTSSLQWTLGQGNQLSDYSGNVTISNNISGGTKTVGANAILTINGNVTINNVDFVMGTNSKIVVPDGSSLTLINTQLEASCVNMWEGIEVFGSGFISTRSSTKIIDAYKGIYIDSDATLSIENTQFKNCYIGIEIGNVSAYQNPISPEIIAFRGNSFYSEGGLLKKLGASINLDRTRAGVKVSNCTYAGFVGNTNKNEFSNLSNGYDIKSTHFDVTGSSFKNCFNGIRAISSLSNRKVASIKSNDFEYTEQCINLTSSMPYINDNTIGVGNKNGISLSYAYGFGINISNNNWDNFFTKRAYSISNSSFLAIHNNTFLSASDTYNNRLINCSALSVNNNVTTPLDIIRCDNSVFTENTIDYLDKVCHVMGGTNNSYNCNLFFSSVYSEMSPQATFSCNEFETNLETDLQFTNNNMMTTLRANTFKSTDVGLLLSGNDTQIGEQRNHGNLWQGLFGDHGAKANLNVLVDLSRFITRNITQEYPSHEPTGFFLNNSNIEPEKCEGFSTCQGYIGADLTPTWLGDEHGISCIDSLFQGSQFASISDEGKWVALYILVRNMVLNDINPITPKTVLSDCEQEIRNLFLNSDEDKIIRAIRLIEGTDLPRPSVPSVEVMAAVSQNATLQVQGNYDPNVLADINTHMANIDKWSKGYQAMLDQDRYTAISSLNSVTSSADGINHLINILPIYIKWLDNEILSTSEMATISYISNTCPSEGSFAKYIAMSINVSYDQGFDISDKLSCDTRSRNNHSTQSTSQDLTVFPNPSSGEFSIELLSNSRIQIKDRLGNIVFDKAFQKGNNKINLNKYPSGIYFLQSISGTDIRTTKKILKI